MNRKTREGRGEETAKFEKKKKKKRESETARDKERQRDVRLATSLFRFAV